MKRKLFSPLLCVFALLLISISSTWAQSARTVIAGRVADSAGAVLEGAQVELQPKGITTVTNGQGEFLFTGVPAGSYKIVVNYVGFEVYEVTVTVEPGQAKNIAVAMKVASANQEIVVTAERVHGEAEAINVSRAADNIIQVLPAEVITSLPNANIADALGRLPSVTIERDEGEGKYVQIRGTEPRLSNLTVDGVSIPSPEPGARQIKLDVIASDLVDSVEINKTLQANMDADGIGGSVNLRTKTAGESPLVSVFGNGGYTPIIGGRDVFQTGATISKRWGATHKLGTLFGGTWDYNGRGINDIEPVPTVTAVSDGAPVGSNGLPVPHYDSMDIRDYIYYRTRWGIAGSADYKLNEGSNIFIRGLYSTFRNWGNKWVFTLNNGDNPEAGLDWRRPDYAVGSVVLGGKHEFKTSWLAWNAAVSRSRMLASGGNGGANFAWNGTDLSGSCFNDQSVAASVYRPGWSAGCFTPGAGNATDIRNYKLTKFTEPSWGESPDLALTGDASYAKQYHVGTHYGTFEFGEKFRTHHKFDDSQTLTYKVPNGTLVAVSDHPEWLSSFTDSGYYDKTYQVGAVTDYRAIRSWVQANGGVSASGPNSSNFDLVERIGAGYLMNTIDLSSRLRLVAGVRFETTHVDGYSFSDGAGAFVGFPAQDYLDVLPSAALRYSLTKDSGLRFVYSRGMSRPDPQDMIQVSSTLDTSQTPNVVSLGNPNLKAEHSQNFDLLYEHYLKPLGMIQAGFFYKKFSDPIIATIQRQDGSLWASQGGTAGTPVLVSQTANGGDAWLYGFEVSFQQHLSYLPGIMKHLGISGNYSYTDSQQSGLTGLLRNDKPAMLRQAPNTWNISPTFDTNKFSMRLGMTYNDAMIYQFQYQNLDGSTLQPLASSDQLAGGTKGPGGDNYLYKHLQIDVQASYKLTRSLTVYGYGLNLNNEVFGFYNGSPQYVVQREYYKPTYAGGLKYTFSRE
jgi:TonB-dependent receptor